MVDVYDFLFLGQFKQSGAKISICFAKHFQKSWNCICANLMDSICGLLMYLFSLFCIITEVPLLQPEI